MSVPSDGGGKAREWTLAEAAEELFGEALTERQTELRLAIAQAFHRVEAKRGEIAQDLDAQELLDAYWDQMDEAFPAIREALRA